MARDPLATLEALTAGPDPRVRSEYLRVSEPAPGTEAAPVVLVGVVHEHPASVARVRAVVDALAPTVLAVELAPAALPAFSRTAPFAGALPRGGEMRAAIRAAATDRIVGIDGPSARFLARLAGTLARERPPRSTVRSVLAGLAAVSAETLRCRFAAAIGRPRAGSACEAARAFGCGASDPPAVQADDERAHVRRAESVLHTFGRPPASALLDRTREAHMADRLAGLRQEGVVVAVVGHGHLDALADRLRTATG